MTFTPVTRLAVLYEPEEGRRIAVGRLLLHRREVLFEYDAAFLQRGLELSPFKLPLRAGVFTGAPQRFDGLMGLFDDSLPDGWGRLLIDRRARRQGLSPAQLGPLDRLSLVGSRAMGALIYEPEQGPELPSVVKLRELEQDIAAVYAERARAPLDELFAIGGSPHGARPKALVQLDGRGRLHAGSTATVPGSTAWMVKFRARDDAPDAGALEHAYALMAKAAGLDVAHTELWGARPGWLATRRFDRVGGARVHQLTLAGLLDAPHTVPSLTSEDLLLATRALVRSEPAVREQFRRACFNVFAHNRDDHSKNFSFLMNEQGRWTLSPAYDLTFSEGPGGEHWLTVAGSGTPSRAHLEELARRCDLGKVSAVIDEVRGAVDAFAKYAREAGVSAKTRRHVASVLGVRPDGAQPRRSQRQKA